MILAVINKRVCPLHFSIDVMFEVNDRFGGVQKALETIERDDRESFTVLRTLAVLMANDAELCRRAEGYDKGPLLEEKEISLRMRPAEYLALKMAVTQAVGEGYRQEQGQDEEVDLGLAELRKNEGAGS